jgi:TIR domain
VATSAGEHASTQSFSSDSPSPAERSKIFISYRRRKLDQMAALWILEWIDKSFSGGATFFDQRDIPPGDDYVDSIRHVIAESEVVVAVIGDGWIDELPLLKEPHDVVALELRIACEKRKPILPVVLPECQMPDLSELPDSLSRLKTINAVQLHNATYDCGIQRLINALRNQRPSSDAVLEPAPLDQSLHEITRRVRRRPLGSDFAHAPWVARTYGRELLILEASGTRIRRRRFGGSDHHLLWELPIEVEDLALAGDARVLVVLGNGELRVADTEADGTSHPWPSAFGIPRPGESRLLGARSVGRSVEVLVMSEGATAQTILVDRAGYSKSSDCADGIRAGAEAVDGCVFVEQSGGLAAPDDLLDLLERDNDIAWTGVDVASLGGVSSIACIGESADGPVLRVAKIGDRAVAASVALDEAAERVQMAKGAGTPFVVVQRGNRLSAWSLDDLLE